MINKKLGFISGVLCAGIMLLGGCGGGNTPGAETTIADIDAEAAEETGAPEGTLEGTEISFETTIAVDEEKVIFSGPGNIADAVIEQGEKYAVMTIRDFGEIKLKLYPDYAPVAVENFISLAESGYYDGKALHRIIPDFMIQGGSEDGTGMSSDKEDSFSIEINPSMRHFYGALCAAKDGLGRVGAQFYIVNSKDTEQFASLQANIDQLEEQVKSIKEVYDQIDALLAQEGVTDRELIDSYRGQYKNQYETSNGLYEAVKNAAPEVAEKYAAVGGTPQLDGGYTVFGQAVDGFDVIDALAAVELEVSASGEERSKPVVDIFVESVEILTD